MSQESPIESQAQVAEASKANDKELNFRRQEEYFKKQLEQERMARLQAEEKVARLSQEKTRDPLEDDGDDDEPYVDHKRLEKKLSKFEQRLEQKIEQKAEEKARKLLDADKQTSYLRENADFNSVMSGDVVQKFADMHPRLAENILRMPEGFERQKLVYENIKALGLDKPQTKQPSIQDKIEANRRSPYYQPTGTGTAPYAPMGDYSEAGKKNAYQKMQELSRKIRL